MTVLLAIVIVGFLSAVRMAMMTMQSERARSRVSSPSVSTSSASTRVAAVAPAFHRGLRRIMLLPLARRLREAIERAVPTVSVGRLAGGWATGAAVCTILAGISGGWRLAGVGLLVGIVAPGAALVLLRHREDALIEAALPDALEALGRSTRSGASLTQALVETERTLEGPIVADIRRLNTSIRLGRPYQQALDDWTERRPLGSVRLAAAALAFGAETGGAPSRAVDGLAASLRDRAALAREVTALAAQARLSAVVIAVLPVGFLVLSSASDDRVVTFLFATGFGRMCLTVGLGLDAIGLLWMHRLTAGIE